MKNKKIILIFLIAILSAFSFSNLYNRYQDKSLFEELSKNSVNHIVNYDLSTTISVDALLNNYTELASGEEIVLYSYMYEKEDKYVHYYNPTQNTMFEDIVNDYKEKCTIDCIKFKEIDSKSFSIGSSSIQIFSSTEIDNAIFSKYNLDVVFIDELEESHFDGNHAEEESLVESIVSEYHLYIIINILVCTTLLLVLFITLISNIREISLHAIYGYRFKTLFLDFHKRYLKVNILTYFIVFNILALVFFRNKSIILVSIAYTLFQIILVYAFFIVLQLTFYNNIKKKYQYRYIQKSIVILSMIITILTVLTAQFMNSSIKHTTEYLDVSESYEISKNYYTLDHDMSIDMSTQAKIANDLVDNYNAIYRYLIIGDYNILEVEHSFFESNEIKDINGNDIVSSIEYAYVVDNEVLDGSNFLNLGYESLELIYIEGTGLEYITLNDEDATVQLKEVVVIVKNRNDMLPSNVSLYSDSKDEVKKIFGEVYIENGIEYEPMFHVMGNTLLSEEYSEKSISSILSLLTAFIAVLVSNISYAYLIFEKNKDKIMLSNIYGQSYFNRMSSMLKENVTVVIMTLTMMIIIGVYAALTYTVILIIQFVILNIVVKNLVGKLLVSNMKGEM